MDLTVLVRGLVVGFTVAAPMGPISLLTIRRTLAHGHVYGLASGLGVALADASYGAVAAFGLTAVTSVLLGARVVLGLVGGAILIGLAIRTMLAAPAEGAEETVKRPGLGAAFGSIYGLTMTNPATILSFGVIFAGLGLTTANAADAALLTTGVFLGSSAWWILLTTLVGRVRRRLTGRIVAWVNRISGVVLLGFGAVAIGIALGVI
jgi:threonine/homoserine/homoserine lactone efflux protein